MEWCVRLPMLPKSKFVVVTMCVNIPFSIAWTFAGASAASLHDALRMEKGETGDQLLSSVSICLPLLCAFIVITRYSRDLLDREETQRGELEQSTELRRSPRIRLRRNKSSIKIK